MSKFKEKLRKLKHVNIFKFIKLNYFTKQIKRNGFHFYNYGKNIIKLAKTSSITLNGDVFFNEYNSLIANSKGSLIVQEKANLVFDGTARFATGVRIIVFHEGNCKLGNISANFNFSLNCRNKIEIGNNSMFGSGVELLDTSGHPYGFSFDSLTIKNKPIIIENRVWVGDRTVIMSGAHIKRGSFIGACCYIDNVVEEKSLVKRDGNQTILNNVLWIKNKEDLGNLKETFDVEQEIKTDNIFDKEIADKLIEALSSKLQLANVNYDTNFFGEGLLDSVGLFALASLLEETFEIEIKSKDISFENFKSVANTVDYVFRSLNSIKKNFEESKKYKTLVERLLLGKDIKDSKLFLFYKNTSYSYGELKSNILNIFDYLNENCRDIEYVFIQSSDIFYSTCLYFAAQLLGVVPALLDKNVKTLTIKKLLDENPNSIFVGDCLEGLNCFSFETFKNLKNNNVDLEEINFPNLEDPSHIVFTSGTTSLAKGVIHSFKSEIQNAKSFVRFNSIDQNSKALSFFPFSHGTGLFCLNSCLYVGATCCFNDKEFDLVSFDELMKNFKPSSLIITPLIAELVSKNEAEILSNYADKIKHVMMISAIVRKPLQDKLKELLPKADLIIAYGSTENGFVTSYNFSKLPSVDNCLGIPEVNVKLLGEDDIFIEKPLKTGIICVKTYSNLMGYLDKNIDISNCFKKDFYITKDIGMFNENGVLQFIGRADDLINIDGNKMYPNEVENLVLNLKEIKECVCFLDNFNDLPILKLQVILAEKEMNIDKIKQYLKENLDSYKVPKIVEVVKVINRTTTGKIRRNLYQNLDNRA